MTKNQWDPVLTLRIPTWQISGLKRIAADTNSTVSALVREQIETLLYVNGITEDKKAPILDGQVSTKDFGV